MEGLDSYVQPLRPPINIAAVMNAMDVHGRASSGEALPSKLGEAMAHGYAAVSSDCRAGPHDLIRNEDDGLLVSPGDVPAMKQDIRPPEAIGQLATPDGHPGNGGACALLHSSRFSALGGVVSRRHSMTRSFP